jgi:hypothetical protein
MRAQLHLARMCLIASLSGSGAAGLSEDWDFLFSLAAAQYEAQDQTRGGFFSVTSLHNSHHPHIKQR